MGTLWQDLRYGLRLLRINPGFTAVAVLSLALGIGANTAIFQLIDAIRLRTIPARNPSELAIVRIADRSWASGNFSSNYSELTFPMWEQIRQRQQAFSSLSVWSNDQFNLASGGEAHYAQGIWVSGDFFRVLGVQPILGRLLSPADDQPGCGAGAVDISYSFWQRHFGGEASVLGKQLTLNGYPFEIIGVTPPGFYGISVGDSFDVAVPVCSDAVINGEDSRLNVRRDWWLASIGRLKPGWSIAQASAQLGAITPAVLQETVPPQYDAEGVKHYLAYKFAAFPAENGFSELRRQSEAPLWLLLGLSGLVLLIACANLANLMLARAGSREREIVVRLAIGASRGRLIRQLLSESLLLALAGAAGGAFLAVELSDLFVSFISTPRSPVFLDMAMDWRVLGFTAGLAILTTVLFGLTPAIRATGMAPSVVLKSGGRGMTAGRERFGLRRILVTVQVALSLVLLVGSLLFVRSLRNLFTLDAGFQQNGILITSVDLTHLNLPPERRAEFKRGLLERVRAIPGVQSAADAFVVPIGGMSSNDEVLGDTPDQKKGNTWINYVSPGYFATVETPLLSGRDFNDGDTATSPKVVIVSEAFVHKFLKGGNPVGQTFRTWEPPGKPEPFYEIVGVVKDSKYQDMHEEFLPISFFPISQREKPDLSDQIIVRSGAALPGLINSLKSTIADVNPAIDIDFRVFKTQIRESLLQDQLMATLSGFFGFLAALLAAIGLYGVFSYAVVQRTNEIGIRMALGAQRSDVVRMIMREAGLILLLGLAAGTGIALAAAQLAASLLFGLKPRDPLTLILAVVTLSLVAALASYVPAYRASRLDPMVALRYE
ncbi:MAG TPA: ABC transporter permease [Candidatus Acidoferrales bacterium]|jgi:predicted permease|nr:ABC transporter permease [Candidatus Acidoferrales bacterium]